MDAARPDATTILARGDTLLLYTDGLVERRHRCLDDGISRAQDILVQHHHLAPAAIAELLAEHLLSDDPDDDIAYLLYQHSVEPG